ncbi:MAG: hypothetical protein A2172_05255 [Candidatus Woykebacteria bacterium RBG_13_40_15]|uniref:Toprim domain-containing protein n=1 Tax=Candidatus Woykebacteria bacterium RBG_13_40_15 TaxID=1802593 RepID=A0A1G1WAB9_9BACT|nr:MAG: hypothetical protein A2172_05255 [Candidatus Woykebacteria bacterium RBG_13_40_15]
MSDLKHKISLGLRSVAKDWKKRKLREDRLSHASLARYRYSSRVTYKDAAFDGMEDAINKVSSNGKYLANARQIMYAVRPYVLEQTGGEIWKDSVYFTQNILKDYLEQHPEKLRMVVWDSRGRLTEPHTSNKTPLGGIEVKEYIKRWKNDFRPFSRPEVEERIDTNGPTNRYSAALFIEKEGFDEILKDAGISEKYDIAIMSTKGVPVKAACDLNRELSARGVKIFVLRDFDLAGFKIVKTLGEGTRMSTGSRVIDMGLRLEDITNLESEPVNIEQDKDPKEYLEICGATKAEREFLVQGKWPRWVGKRVELNAMTSEEFIGFIEKKLKRHKVTKLVPEEETLNEAYKRAVYQQRIEAEIDKIEDDIRDQEIEVPKGLQKTVSTKLRNSKKTWDDVIWSLAEENV